jgi:hypothetical protein
MAFGRHVEGLPTFRPRREFLWANSFKKNIGERTGWAVEKSTRAKGWLCSEVKMVLFSRSFIRKRAIALATTASVAATSLVMAHVPTSAQRISGTMPIQYVADWHDNSDEGPFLSENRSAMNKMMADMTVKPTGDVDRDFVEMMVPHHQGAIDMARAELKYGRNEQLRRMSQEIIVTQQQEIAAMRLAVGDPLPPSAASPTQPDAAPAPRPGAMPPVSSHDAMSHGSMNMK